MTRLMKLVELVSKISYMRSKVQNNGYMRITDISDQLDMWAHWTKREVKIRHLIYDEYEKKV